MNYGPGCDRFVTVGALGIHPLFVKALLAQGAVVARLSQHTTGHLLTLSTEL